MAEDRKKAERANDASEEELSQQTPKWGLTTYRVKCIAFNILQCRSDITHTRLEEAEAEAERLLENHGEITSLVRITAERDMLYGPSKRRKT